MFNSSNNRSNVTNPTSGRSEIQHPNFRGFILIGISTVKGSKIPVDFNI